MSHEHLSEKEIADFVQGDEVVAGRALAHLAAGCLRCQKLLGPFIEEALADEGLERGNDGSLAAAQGVEAPEDLERRIDLAIDRSFAATRRRLHGVGIDFARQQRLLVAIENALEKRNGALTLPAKANLHGWPAVEALLQASFNLRYLAPHRMLELAILARWKAKYIDPARYGLALVADFQARATAELSNAYRVVDDLPLAQQELDCAEALLAQGTGDVLLQARVLEVRASLLAHQRHLAAACSVLEEVEAIYRELNDAHLTGRALVKRGAYSLYRGESLRAVDLVRQGLELLEPVRDPNLLAAAHQNLLAALADCGRFKEAASLLLESGLRQALAGQTLILNKLRWLEGQIHAGLGHQDRAEEAFLEVRGAFVEHGQHLNAAIAGLDLSQVWLRQGKITEVERLAQEMVRTFERLNIHREAILALNVLMEACRRKWVSAEMLAEMRRLFQLFENDARTRPGA